MLHGWEDCQQRVQFVSQRWLLLAAVLQGAASKQLGSVDNNMSQCWSAAC